MKDSPLTYKVEKSNDSIYSVYFVNVKTSVYSDVYVYKYAMSNLKG